MLDTRGGVRDTYRMNKLPTKTRAQILGMLVEGMSMRSITRITGVSINTVAKLLTDAGAACAKYHDEHVRNVRAERIEADEIWSFVYSKQKNVRRAKAAPEAAGDAWTWTALDPDSKLMVSWLVADRGVHSAMTFMRDLESRLAGHIQLTTDGHGPYRPAVDVAFEGEIDYAMLIKEYAKIGSDRNPETRYSPSECIGTHTEVIEGEPDPAKVSTSYVERSNLTLRMGNRRFTRLTNAFSKRVEKHVDSLALSFVHYNFCRIHTTLRVTPAMEAGLTDTLHDLEWIVGLIDANAPTPKKPGPKPGSKYQKSN